MPYTNIEGGYLLWARKTLDSEIFLDKPAEWFKIWFFLVMRVHWSDDKRLPRGSINLSYQHIKDGTGVGMSSIDHFFRWARSGDGGTPMLATRKATRGTVITLLNYEKYQDHENYKSDTKSEVKAKSQRSKSDTILNEGKKVINKEGTQGEGEAAAPPPSPTPRDEAQAFFESEEKQQAIVSWLLSRGTSEEAAKRELSAFVSYWTEPTPNGKRQRWETEKVFEIKRRAGRDSQRGGTKPSQQWHVAQ